MIFAKLHLPFHLSVTFTSKLVLHQAAPSSALLAHTGSGLCCAFSFPVNSKLPLQVTAYFLSITTRETEQRWRRAEMEVSAFSTMTKHLTRWIL